MSLEQLLSELRSLDIRFFADGDRLRCSAPKGRLTVDLERKIAAYKPELLGALRNPDFDKLPIPRHSAEGASLPLSFAQQRFWFLQKLEAQSAAYNISAYKRVYGLVETSLLQTALRAVFQKHSALRAGFPEIDGVPAQVIREDVSPELDVHDLSHLERATRETAAEALIEQMSRRPFELSRDVLLRATVIRLGSEEQIVAVTMHHIVCDGWSLGILFADLSHFYEAYLRGGSVEIPEPPVQYLDYAFWERDRQASAAVAAQMEYWKDKLRDSAPYLELSTDYPRPLSPSFRARWHDFELTASESETLKAFASQEGATPYMTLLTVFNAALFRYTRQRDILVGTPVSTRTRPELEQLIGCFINTHVLRTTISAGITTRELLSQVRGTVLETLNNADVPFEALVNELVRRRDLSRSPLFQVAFILQNAPLDSEFTVMSGGSAFDLSLYMREANGSIRGSVEYSADLFRPDTIARFVDCLLTLAGGMLAQPDAPIERLPVLTPAQEEEWFRNDHGPRMTHAGDTCTHEWIERQIAATPNATAVVSGEEKLTYRQLGARSNRLAERLRTLGVGPNSLVGLCLDRTVDMVVAPLAVWGAGAAYVPLDPTYPSARLAFMLEDSGAPVVVTQSWLLDRLPLGARKVICVDRERQLLERGDEHRVASSGAPDRLAYVIYTSGSTGNPKGVEVQHRALVNFLSSMQREPGFAPSDRLLAVTTLSFDIAGLELYLPLVTGGQVVIAPAKAVIDGSALAQLLLDSLITIMQATPVTWRLLLESGWRGSPALRILCGGEALTRDLADRLLSCGAEVWNLYGPTETTIWSTLQRVATGHKAVPIGRPIANTRIYVMDEYGQPVPPGVAGELYIGGDGLARGYLRRPELTEQRFVELPSHPGERLYRTGDLVRRLPDGRLEYIARADHQVKLRGFRIELGEIEAALQRQPGVLETVVLVREAQSGNQRLTAYVRMQSGISAQPTTLRKGLMAILPEYMVPAAFVQIDALPLTLNRKVDRNVLLAMDDSERRASDPLDSAAKRHDQSSAEAGYSPSNDHLEAAMIRIWEEVLEIPRVGVHDSFFELGGHSLSAARLIARLRSVLGIELPLRGIFLDPTIAGLARHIAYDSAAKRYGYTSEIPRWSCLVPAQPKGSRPPFFFAGGYTSPDDTLLVLSRLMPHLGMDQPVFGLRPRWIDGTSEGYATVEQLAEEFLAEIRAVQPHGPYLLGGYCVGGIAAVEVAKLLLAEGEEVGLLALLDTERPTRYRTLLNDIYFMRVRMRHIADVVSEIIHPRGRRRGEIISGLTRRKIGIGTPQKDKEADRFYKLKTEYRRLLYGHDPKRYPGRIMLMVNEERARYDRDLGWAGIAEGGLEVYTLPGDHLTILTHHGKQVAQLIREHIEECLSRSESPHDAIEVMES